jgi:Zn-dependent peptidase ImmA (M78 family)
MFTLVHEVAHLWLGQSALSDSGAASFHDHGVERWCNQVAAEVLVPLAVLETRGDRNAADLVSEASRLARIFKVSSLVILRRLHDAGWISRSRMWTEYEAELERLRTLAKGKGGNFYKTQPVRLGRRFATSVVLSTLSGQTLYTDAFRLLGIKKVSTLKELGQNLGIPV